MRQKEKSYRGYFIAENSYFCEWWHQHYDGPGDVRCGLTMTAEEAKRAIDEQIEELEDK